MALNTYETASWTSGLLGAGDAVRKTLMFSLESLGTSVPVPIHYGRVDNVFLEVMTIPVPEPSALSMIAVLGSGLLFIRRKYMR
jgi:hypothetical protein